MLLTLLTSTRGQWCLGAQALSVVTEEGQGGEDFPDVPSSLAGTSGVTLETLGPIAHMHTVSSLLSLRYGIYSKIPLKG